MIPVFDGHNDTLLNLHRPERGGGRTFFERSERGHIDLPRARAGGFGGGFFAVFVPPEQPASPAIRRTVSAAAPSRAFTARSNSSPTTSASASPARSSRSSAATPPSWSPESRR